MDLILRSNILYSCCQDGEFFLACKNICVSLSYGQPALAYKSPLYMFPATRLIRRKIDRFIRTAVLNVAVCVPDTLLRLLRCTVSQLHPHSVAARWGKPPSAASEVINFTLVGVGSHSWSAMKSRRAGFQREQEKGKTIPAISSGNTAGLYSNQPLYMLNNSSCLVRYISSLRCGQTPSYERSSTCAVAT